MSTALAGSGPEDEVAPRTRPWSGPEELRTELAAWLAANLSEEVRAAGRAGLHGRGDVEVLRGWNRLLADAGWAAISWPSEHGGRDASVAEQLTYHEVMAEAEAPGPLNVIGLANIAPAIMAFGRPEQAARFLRPMLRGDEIWCQGMSEPDAGSDLASLRTAAAPADDGFVVNGQKTWNSLGEHADWCQLYVRTDPGAPKHKGISCLLVDMRTPGIEVRPLRTMAGDTSFAELFFTDVHVPADSLLGPLHEGWRVAMTTLSFERAGVAKFHLGLQARFDELVAGARAAGTPLSPVLRDRLARLYSQIACMRWTTSRELAVVGAGGKPPPALGSLIKLLWADASQELADIGYSLFGDGAADAQRHWAWALLNTRANSIAGGTTEINRNIVGEHGLGLP
ncbi:MAG TPA: acyl-CoA dehydrogenase family protein, partial [Acidimicrobiales bacterium]|nr:acyl-CoA dehydrogenase family protein [Acidimicrobiales bacterium]